MHLTTTATLSDYQASPDVVRARVLGRRIKASASVTALLAEIAFGSVDRDRATTVPMLSSGGH